MLLTDLFAHIKLQHASQFSFSTRVHMSFVQSQSSVGLKHLAKLSFPQWSPGTFRSHRWSHCSQIVCISWESRSTWSCVDLHRTFVTGTGWSSWNLNWIRCHHWLLLFFLIVLNDHQVCSAQHRAQTPLGAHRFMVVSAVCIDQRCLQIVSGISALEVVNRLHGQPYVAACSCARDLVMYRFRIPPGTSAMRPRGFHGTPTNMGRVSGFFQCCSAAIRLNDRVVSLHFVVPTISSERSSEKKPRTHHLLATSVPCWFGSGVACNSRWLHQDTWFLHRSLCHVVGRTLFACQLQSHISSCTTHSV